MWAVVVCDVYSQNSLSVPCGYQPKFDSCTSNAYKCENKFWLWRFLIILLSTQYGSMLKISSQSVANISLQLSDTKTVVN